MNEEMEAQLTEIDSRPDNLAVSEDEKIDESIPIELRKERRTEGYKETMSKVIYNIDTYETRKQKLIQQNGGQYVNL